MNITEMIRDPRGVPFEMVILSFDHEVIGLSVCQGDTILDAWQADVFGPVEIMHAYKSIVPFRDDDNRGYGAALKAALAIVDNSNAHLVRTNWARC